MHLPTIHTSPSDRPKFDFLQIHNFLGEFRSEIDKARVRYNLGIPDEYSLTWENITGQIATNTTLVDYINNSFSGTKSKVDALITSVNALNTSNTSLVNKVSDLETASGSYTSLAARLTALETDVNLNAALIKTLSGGSSASIDLSSYATLSWVTSQNYLKSSDLSNYITSSELNTYATLLYVNDQIQAALASDTLVSISCEDLTFDVNGTGTLRVIGKYSKSSDKELSYSDYTCSGYDTSLISISNGVVTPLKTGSTSIIISSGTVSSVTVSITITSNQEVSSYPLYIGFATSETLVFENATFKVDTISGTWNSSNVHTYGSSTGYGIFIITTLDIDTIKQGSLSLDLNQTKTLTHSTNGLTYKVYMPGTTTDPSKVEFTITLK